MTTVAPAKAAASVGLQMVISIIYLLLRVHRCLLRTSHVLQCSDPSSRSLVGRGLSPLYRLVLSSLPLFFRVSFFRVSFFGFRFFGFRLSGFVFSGFIFSFFVLSFFVFRFSFFRSFALFLLSFRLHMYARVSQ